MNFRDWFFGAPRPSTPPVNLSQLEKLMAPVDLRLVMEMLKGSKNTRIGSMLRFHHYGNAIRAYTLCYTPGGYHLIMGTGDAFMLNLDVAIQFDNSTLIKYRRAVLALADHLGAPVIPFGELAFSRGPCTDAAQTSLQHIHHTSDMEGVFTLTASGETRYYLSGYDTQESPPRVHNYKPPGLYFMCRLPHPVSTVDEARESLKPDSVRNALAAGIEVKRQGDLFAIKSEMTRADVEAAGGAFREYRPGEVVVPHPPWMEAVFGDDPVIAEMLTTRATTLGMGWMERPASNTNPGFYGTAHICTTSARLPNGMWVGSGTMHHDPALIGERRSPDHSPLELGQGFHLIIKNTVPVAVPVRSPQRW